jgi:hypothetical protein
VDLIILDHDVQREGPAALVWRVKELYNIAIIELAALDVENGCELSDLTCQKPIDTLELLCSVEWMFTHRLHRGASGDQSNTAEGDLSDTGGPEASGQPTTDSSKDAGIQKRGTKSSGLIQ